AFHSGDVRLRVSAQHTQLHRTEVRRRAARIDDWKRVTTVCGHGITARGQLRLQAVHIRIRYGPVRSERNHLPHEHELFRLAIKVRSESAHEGAHQCTVWR